MARVLLHCGFQKTGTTYIQALLKKNLSLIDPTIAVYNKGPGTRKLQRACATYIMWGKPVARTELVDTASEISAQIRDSGRDYAIITNENLLGANVYGKKGGDIFTWGEQVLPAVLEGFAGHVVRLVFYTREPQSWWRSVHAQAIRTRRVRAPLEDYVARAPFTLNWREVAQRYWNHFGTDIVQFVEMEDDLATDFGLGDALLRSAGLDDAMLATLEKPPVRNASIKPGALEVIRKVNATKLTKRELKLLRTLVMKNQDLFEDDGQPAPAKKKPTQ